MNSRRQDDLTKFVTHLPLNSTDRVVVILKGHLLVEELLREYTASTAISSEYLADARLTFHQCLCIARSFDPEPVSNKKLWAAISKLNSLRNKLAHNLEPKDIECKIDEFVEFLSLDYKGEVFADEDGNFGNLTMSVFALAQSLSVKLDPPKYNP